MPYNTKEKKTEYMRKYRLSHPNLSRDGGVRNPEKVKARNAKTRINRVTFKNKRVRVGRGFNPRTGICSKCGKSVQKGEIKRTNIHHDQYDEQNPLAHTRELCPSCHRKEHIMLERSKKNVCL